MNNDDLYKPEYEYIEIEKLFKTQTNGLPDITQDYVDFLSNKLKTLTDPSFLMWNLGTRGWGKTSFTFSTLNLIMNNDPGRFVQFLLATDLLIDNINEACPDNLKGRFYTIEGLRDVNDYAILIIDEGLIGANAANALTREMKKLEGFLSNSRHYDVIFIINSVNFKVLRTIRGIIDIKVYKHLSEMFFIEYGKEDQILQEHIQEIKKLSEPEGLMFSGFKKFEKIGKFNLDFKKYCPWYNGAISKHMRNANPDYYYEAYLRTWENNRKIAKEIVKEIGPKYKIRGGFKFFKAWFYNRYKEKFYDYQDDLKDIYELYLFFIKEGYYEKIKQEEQGIELISMITKDFTFKYDPEEIFEIIRKEKRFRKFERDIEIYKRRQKGELLDDLAEEYDDLNSAQAINNVELKVQGAFSDYKGHLFEKTAEKFFEDQDNFEFIELDGAPGKADLKIFDEKNSGLYIFSLKCEDIESNVRTFYPKELKPELSLAYHSYTFGNYDFVYMLLWVFNTHNDKFRLENVNFLKPEPITLSF
jgi:hypothetical protein